MKTNIGFTNYLHANALVHTVYTYAFNLYSLNLYSLSSKLFLMSVLKTIQMHNNNNTRVYGKKSVLFRKAVSWINLCEHLLDYTSVSHSLRFGSFILLKICLKIWHQVIFQCHYYPVIRYVNALTISLNNLMYVELWWLNDVYSNIYDDFLGRKINHMWCYT